MSCPFVFQMKISSMQWAFVVHYLFSFLVPMFICLCNYAQMSPCKESSPYTHLYLSMVESSPCSKNLMFILLQAHLMYSTHQQVFVHNNHYVETRHISLISKCHHLLKLIQITNRKVPWRDDEIYLTDVLDIYKNYIYM